MTLEFFASWPAYVFLALQGIILLLFGFYAFFNYLYAINSLRTPKIPRVSHSNRRIAVVIVARNERHVLPTTIESCELLTYPNRILIVADDSDDAEVVEQLETIARSRGCTRARPERGREIETGGAAVELWESPGFVYMHRDRNIGFKGGILRAVHSYLQSRGIDLMYLLDADWHPQRDALERTLEVLEADKRIAFVQTKRITSTQNIHRFQRYIAIQEEGCYYVDFEGRQVLGHPILFSGCCALLRLDAVAAVGGFASGHLTEDLDLSNRLWLAGRRGIYLGDVVNYGEVPFAYYDFRRQQDRWSTGTGMALRQYWRPIATSNQMSVLQRLSALRQNAYYATGVLVVVGFFVAFANLLWLVICANTYAVEFYLQMAYSLRSVSAVVVYTCLLSNFAEGLVSLAVKQRRFPDLVHGAVATWYAWSNMLTYAWGTLWGFSRGGRKWFVTPKFPRSSLLKHDRQPGLVQLQNGVACAAFAVFYSLQGWTLGWFDPTVFLWLPAFAIVIGE